MQLWLQGCEIVARDQRKYRSSPTFEKLESSLFLLSIPVTSILCHTDVYMWRPAVNDACLVDRSAKCYRAKRKDREIVYVFASVHMYVCIYMDVCGRRRWRVCTCTCVCVSKVEVGWDREQYYLAWRNVLLLFSFSSVHNLPEIGEMEKQSLYTHRDTENTGDE